MKRLFTFLAVLTLTIPLLAHAAAVPAFRAKSDAPNNTNNIVTTKPAGTKNNDVLIAYMETLNSGATAPTTLTAPAGWTQIGSTQTQAYAAGFAGRYGYWYKVASGEGANYTWTANGNAGSTGMIDTYKNIDVSKPLDTSGTGTYTGSATCVASSITTTRDNDLVFLVCLNAAASAVTWTPPGGMTERTDLNSAESSDVVQAAVGATGSKTATGSLAADGHYFLAAFNALPEWQIWTTFFF